MPCSRCAMNSPRPSSAHRAVEPPSPSAAAARRGTNTYKELKASRGRATYVGERSVGFEDPGAVTIAVLWPNALPDSGIRGHPATNTSQPTTRKYIMKRLSTNRRISSPKYSPESHGPIPTPALRTRVACRPFGSPVPFRSSSKSGLGAERAW